MNLGTYSYHFAGVLAKIIETYWHERGHGNVRAERYEIAGYPNHWGVRSNLVAGLPPKLANGGYVAPRLSPYLIGENVS